VTDGAGPGPARGAHTGQVTPRPASPGPRDDTWLWALVGLALGLFSLGFLVRWRCAVGSCPLPGREWIVDLDAIGGLPRLFTTAVFAATAVAAAVAAVQTRGTSRLWWSAVTAIGVGLVFAKLVSAHSVLETTDGTTLTLLAGTVCTVVGLPALWAAGRAWGVAGSGLVVLGLAVYAVAALGLDVVTRTVAVVQPQPLPLTAATFVEELGEALTAVALLGAVARARARRRLGGRGQHAGSGRLSRTGS